MLWAPATLSLTPSVTSPLRRLREVMLARPPAEDQLLLMCTQVSFHSACPGHLPRDSCGYGCRSGQRATHSPPERFLWPTTRPEERVALCPLTWHVCLHVSCVSGTQWNAHEEESVYRTKLLSSRYSGLPAKLGVATLEAHAVKEHSLGFCKVWSGLGFEVRWKLGAKLTFALF